MESKSQNQNSSLTDDKQFKVNQSSDSDDHEQNMLKKNQHKKIRKSLTKRKSSNWGSGRPSKRTETNDDHQWSHQLKNEALSGLWFGRDISMKMIIYLCKMGNMIFKVVTGIPASKIRKGFMKFDSNSHQDKKKYSLQLKKDLKNKNSRLLEYLNYPADTTYMFLEKNNNCEDKLSLKNISEESQIGLEVVMKSLSKNFVNTYKFIIREYFQNSQDFLENNLVDNIVRQLVENHQDHKMLFDRQLIHELTKDDYALINEIESDPYQAQIHQYQNSGIRNINFFSNTYKDEVEEIKKNSFWIREFIEGFIEILQGSNIQIQHF
ncbi:unnamed protein product (macronuclear) [Paramecium tetraurelia]|uniref:Uncharacterized protein n=1 Tax=Paramecium tetraurelia TaxID=5888 RepID=A0DTL2_PARTE|nr:uncharacterized protein GSPATT00020060001 [Paramecium tetraurelia]CAK86379.1 unnamed protein product [Paramecium tetraurelia]|eukprot:XP_001453776.1 hypothetical protein (macronuclear) [Paramecium tetraurelia strain d4-2]